MEGLVIPALITAAASIITYYLGTRRARHEIIDKKQLEVAEEIATTIQELFDNHEYIYNALHLNEEKIGLERLVESFDKHVGLYGEVREAIKSGYALESNVNEKLRKARLFVKGNLPIQIQRYINLGQFTFSTDGGIFHNDWFEQYIRNILNSHKQKDRVKLRGEIIKNIRQLLG